MDDNSHVNWTLLSGLIAVVAALIVLTVCYILSSDAEEPPQDDATTFTPIVSPFVADNAPTAQETQPEDEEEPTLTSPSHGEAFVEGILGMIADNRADLRARRLEQDLEEAHNHISELEESNETLTQALEALVLYLEAYVCLSQ